MHRIRHFVSCCVPKGASSLDRAEIRTLRAITAESFSTRTIPWKLQLQDRLCKVVKVYDGDSVTLAWWDENATAVVRANCRMHGIDTPELRSTDSKAQIDAWKCKNMLTDAVLGEIVTVSTMGRSGLDKYGRPLVVIRAHPTLTSLDCRTLLKDHESLNDWALHWLPGCVPYFGGAKGATTARDA